MPLFFLFATLSVFAENHGKPFGLVSNLTQDTEIVFGLTHFEDFANEISKSKTWEKIIELLITKGDELFLDIANLFFPIFFFKKFLLTPSK